MKIMDDQIVGGDVADFVARVGFEHRKHFVRSEVSLLLLVSRPTRLAIRYWLEGFSFSGRVVNEFRIPPGSLNPVLLLTDATSLSAVLLESKVPGRYYS